MIEIRHTIFQIYCSITNTEHQKESERNQHIRDQISGLEKHLQILKNQQYANRTKTGEIKKHIFKKTPYQHIQGQVSKEIGKPYHATEITLFLVRSKKKQNLCQNFK